MDWEVLIGLALFILVVGFVIFPIISLIKISAISRRQKELAEKLRDMHQLLSRQAAPPVSPSKPAVETPARPIAPCAMPELKSQIKPENIVEAPMPRITTPAQPPPLAALQREPERSQPPPPPRAPSGFEETARRILAGIWNWIIVGAEHRPEGVSMEYAVATNWLLRLGILILVSGVGFFLRYSIVHGLIGPLGRVTLSLFVGAAMLAAGLRLLGKKYHLLGQGLLGGGLATLYFSAFAAFSFYHLIDAPVAFALMAVITIGAGGMAVRFNSALVAVLGIVGGYGTPVMLSTGEVQFIGLFSYMLLLGCGVFWIAYRKNWHLLNFLSLACTYALFFAAMSSHYSNEYFWQVMPFLAAFFVLFSTMEFIHNLVNRQPSNLLELIGLLVNAGIVFGAGFHMIDQAYGREWTAVLTVGLAAFYVLHVYYLLIRKIHDRNLLVSFLGLGAFFLSVTIPLILSHEWITVSWALEAMVLLWMAAKLESEFLRQIAYLLYALMLGRFFFVDMGRQFGGPAPSADLPAGQYLWQMLPRLVSAGIPIASLGVAFRLLIKPACKGVLTVGRSDDVGPLIRERWAVRTLVTLAVAMLFLYLHLELNRTVGCLYEPLRLPVLTLVWLAMCSFLLALYSAALTPGLMVLLSLFMAGMLGKLIFVDLTSWHLVFERGLCYASYSGTDATMRLLDFGAILGFMAWGFVTLRRCVAARSASQFMGYAGLALLFLYASLELNTFLGIYIPGLRAGGITILWSVFALAFILSGILKQVAPLRFLGLALFVVVAAKIFLFDLSHLEQIYRIIAFTVLGVVLLCGSFVYLKYRQTFAVRKEDES
ncbi:MAG: DUF2339 domain-containing protein [Kiritimatiellae bacterium]|nr:DUF2339 domain-containing protein [Kiritimatiellia bacterium]